MKPRHHTLQGICQDVCVNYQSVTEVLRRIAEVCLEENGTVITQEVGTFFCRSVQARTGVLNDTPWTSRAFLEVGVRGKREYDEPIHRSTFSSTRISFNWGSPRITDSVLSDALGSVFWETMRFRDDGHIFRTNHGGDEIPSSFDQNINRSEEIVEGREEAGVSEATVSLLLEDQSTFFNANLIQTIERIGPLIAINGTPLGIGTVVPLHPSELNTLSFIPHGDEVLRVSGHNLRFSYTLTEQRLNPPVLQT